MASVDRIILCGGCPAPARPKPDETVELNLAKPSGNVALEITDLSRKLAAEVPDILTDLVEVATYVYCADQAVTRGGDGTLAYGRNWRRSFHFHVPVRNPSFWSSREVTRALQDTLSFLSDDEYDFHFVLHTNPPQMQQYLKFNGGQAQGSEIDEVILFPGGLDSLGGAVEEAVVGKRKVALVSHRSNPKIHSRQKRLVTELASFCNANRPLHVPEWVHKKDEALEREHTQRSRTFLYAALATAVAVVFNLKRIRFYENGTVSLNLPISEQVIGARATRTTHPQVLNGFANLLSLLVQEPFRVENPFLWITKTEAVNLIGNHGCGNLIKDTVSCMHTRDLTIQYTHCGSCSQCISRRFATLASRFAELDPAEMYKVDLLLGERKLGVDLTLVESFIRNASDVRSMNDVQLIERYGEISRVLRHVQPLSADQVAEGIIQLYRKHADEVSRVMDCGMSANATAIREGRLPTTCAIILSLPKQYRSDISGSQAPTETAVVQSVVAAAASSLAADPESTPQSDKRPRVARSIGSPAAVKAALAYMQERGWGYTQFATQMDTTDRTVRNFLKTGKMRRSSFETMAARMGLTTEQLLRGELLKKTL